MKVGFGRSDITPRLGVQLAGYGPYRNRAAAEIVAPLHARAVLLRDRARTALIVSVELCGLPRELDARIRAEAARAAGVDAEEVFLSVTHTHSAPAVGGMLGWGEADQMYVETLPIRAAAAAAQARAALADAEWRVAAGACEGIAVNRETDAGFAMNADLDERLDPAWRPAHPEQTDPTVRVLAAYSSGRLIGLLHHFACHPVVYGEKTAAIHGDYAGIASLRLEAAHPGTVALFLPGALGDLNPKLNHRNPAESLRALRAIARLYAAAIQRSLRAAQPLTSHELRTRRTRATFARQPWTRPQVLRRIAQLEQVFRRAGITDFPHTGGQPPLLTHGMELTRLNGLRALLAGWRGNRAPNPPVCLHGVRIGPVALLGFGLELYHSLQHDIVTASPHPQTWLVSLVGGMGYAPDAAAQARAGYAADFVPLMCGEIPYRRIHRELPAALIGLARALS
jgi:hypothetical protein